MRGTTNAHSVDLDEQEVDILVILDGVKEVRKVGRGLRFCDRPDGDDSNLRFLQGRCPETNAGGCETSRKVMFTLKEEERADDENYNKKEEILLRTAHDSEEDRVDGNVLWRGSGPGIERTF